MKRSIYTIIIISISIGLLSIPVAFAENTILNAPPAGGQIAPGGLHQGSSSGLLKPAIIVPNHPAPAPVTPAPNWHNPSPVVTHPYPGWRPPVLHSGGRYPAPWWRPGPGPWRLPAPGWRPGPGWYWGHHFYWEFRFWPRPPLPWYWTPPPPRLSNWWFWVWWQPLPISVQYYYPPTVVYPNNYYYPYTYNEPAPGETPEYYAEPQPVYPNAETQTPGNMPQIKSQEDYENWLIKTLNLTDKQEKPFIQKFRDLATLREKFIEKSAGLGNEIATLQKTNPTSAELTTKQEKLQNAEFEFRKKEQKLMNELMAILTLQQREAFMNQMQQYTSESASEEEMPSE
ncbi:MAG: hypothetical protein ACE14V_09260 [bacterium]